MVEEHGSHLCQIRRLNPPGRLPLAKTCQPGPLRPASTLRTFIFSEFLRDVHQKAPPMIVGTFNASKVHSLVVNPVGSRRSQHVRKSRKDIKKG